MSFKEINTEANPETNLSAQELFDIGLTLQRQGKFAESIAYFDDAIEMAPEHFAQIDAIRYSSAWQEFKIAQDVSDWSKYDQLQRMCHQGAARGQWFVGEATLATPMFTNFTLLRFTQAHAHFFFNSIKDHPTKTFELSRPVAGKKIKLGFVGADFYSQATAYLLTAAIACIDRERFEVFAYDFGDEAVIREGDDYRARAYTAYDHIVPIQQMSDLEVAERIHADGIDVLFSIKNPASARLGIFALRPAAIQIHYLYFPGTSGMPFFDYMISDNVVTPPELDYGFSEKILRIEGCYQPNDDQRELPAESTRADWGVPEDAVVLANMSQNYKITPQMFDVWCRLLLADERRVLWLLSNDEVVEANLRKELSQRQIQQERLIFSESLPLRQHHARLRCADIIVDTFPYGGHTLTSDALWAGTPVVTLAGTTYASRVAASLLASVGLVNLVALHEDEYFMKIDTLARDEPARKALRKHLDDGRSTFDLFNPKSYARRFEKLMIETVENHWAK